MIKGFKDFLLRGNVIDLAIAVVIGAAFTAVVNAVANDVIGGLVAAIFGSQEVGEMGVRVGRGTVVLGTTVSALINFVIVAAFIYFVIVVPMNRLLALRKQGVEPEVAAPSEDVLLLQEIRDLLRDQQRGDRSTAGSPAGPTDAPAAEPRHREP